jgi:hypothetical protein
VFQEQANLEETEENKKGPTDIASSLGEIQTSFLAGSSQDTLPLLSRMIVVSFKHLLAWYLSWYNNGLQAVQPGFDSQQGSDFYLYSIQTSPGAQPDS